MFLIMDIVPMLKVLLKIPGSCETCHTTGEIELIKTYECFRFFFIPLFKWHTKYYLRHSCGGQVPITEEVALNLLYGKLDLQTIKFEHTENIADQCLHCGHVLEKAFAYCPYCGKTRH